MPALAPNAEKLCAENLIYVTQDLATTPRHRDVAAEVTRVSDIAKQTGKRAEAAKAFLLKLKHELLVLGYQITVKSTHTFLPGAYFEAICPRYMDLPDHPRALVLRWKLGNTKRAPFSCLELVDANEVCLPWTTVHSGDEGYKTCAKSFKDYTALVRHLATRHVVLWLAFQCPWCVYCGFEKVKVTRHVSTCKSMPAAVIELVDAVELLAPPSDIVRLARAASKDLNKVREHDSKHGLKRRITLAMTRSQAKFRKFAESSKKGEKSRWPKSVTPNTEGVNHEDGTGIFNERMGKFPFFTKCGSCSQILMDTQLASKAHLGGCDVKGFATFHSMKALDEGVVSANDRRIFRWKEEAENAAKEFKPTITCTIDGYGYYSKDKRTHVRLGETMKKVAPVNGYRARKLTVKDETTATTGHVRIISTVEDHRNIKTDLTERVLKLSSFKHVVKKRKMILDVDDNQLRKCTRRTSAHELLVESFIEYHTEEVEEDETMILHAD